MAATPLLGLTLPTTGTLSGTWGETVNNEITSLLDSAVAGTTTLSTDADVTLTATVSSANQARAAILSFTGARTALRTIIAPAQSKTYVVYNQTSGGFSVKLAAPGPTTGVTILNGETAVVAWNGADFVRIATLGGPITGSTGVFTGAVSGTTFTGNVTGNVTGNISGATGTFTGNVQMTSANGGQLAGLRNKIINGNMGIFQRGTTAVTTNGTYGPADRWESGFVGGSFSTTQGSFVSGDTLYDTGGAQFYTQIVVTSPGTGAGNYVFISQKIEDVRLLAGQTVTVSFWAKVASGTSSIGVNLQQNFGTGGSATVTGTGQAQALTTTWTQYSKTFTLPSINGKTVGTATTHFTQLVLWLDAGSTYNTESGSIGQVSKTVSIAQVQLEVGPVATPFEQRPIGMELALCQRYLPRAGMASGWAYGLNAGQYAFSYLVQPRVASTGVTVLTNAVLNSNGTPQTSNSATWAGSGTNSAVLNLTSAANFCTSAGSGSTAINGDYLFTGCEL